MSANPDSLPPDEAPVARALNETGKNLADVDAAAKPLETSVDAQVVQPLASIKTKEDVANVKKAAEALKDASGKRRDVLNGLQANMTTQLKAAGLSDDMASQVTNLFIERNAIAKQAARSDALTKLADAALGATDYLEKNAEKWKPSKEAGISFSDKKTMEGFQASYQQVQQAIQQVNAAL
jgi:molecular chaperone GrpE (heat shock protein)